MSEFEKKSLEIQLFINNWILSINDSNKKGISTTASQLCDMCVNLLGYSYELYIKTHDIKLITNQSNRIIQRLETLENVAKSKQYKVEAFEDINKTLSSMLRILIEIYQSENEKEILEQLSRINI